MEFTKKRMRSNCGFKSLKDSWFIKSSTELVNPLNKLGFTLSGTKVQQTF